MKQEPSNGSAHYKINKHFLEQINNIAIMVYQILTATLPNSMEVKSLIKSLFGQNPLKRTYEAMFSIADCQNPTIIGSLKTSY